MTPASANGACGTARRPAHLWLPFSLVAVLSVLFGPPVSL